jgi:hypothetical protein
MLGGDGGKGGERGAVQNWRDRNRESAARCGGTGRRLAIDGKEEDL